MSSVKIISYNILAQRYLDPHISTKYKHIKNKQVLEWDNRKEKIISQIKGYDIICLQEVELATWKEDFDSLLIDYNYNCHIVTKKRSSAIGNITLYKNIECIKSIDKSSGIINIFKIDDKDVCLVNVHLKAGYNSGEKVRESQLISILKECKYDHCIICGDFNDDLLEYDSIKKLTTGAVDNNRLLYKLLNDNSFEIGRKQLTCCVNEVHFWSFDHVVSKGLNISIYNCDKMTTIPNESVPSDHLPLKFKFSLK